MFPPAAVVAGVAFAAGATLQAAGSRAEEETQPGGQTLDAKEQERDELKPAMLPSADAEGAADVQTMSRSAPGALDPPAEALPAPSAASPRASPGRDLRPNAQVLETMEEFYEQQQQQASLDAPSRSPSPQREGPGSGSDMP